VVVPLVFLEAVQFLRKKGLSKDAATAVSSVLYAESALHTGSQGRQSTETPGVLNPSGAFGIASWNGPRQTDLADHAASWNLDVNALETQLQFVLTEMANKYHQSWTAVNSMQPYSAIIPTIVEEYEVPKDVPAEVARAKTYADEFYPQIIEEVPVLPTVPIPSVALPVPPLSLDLLGQMRAIVLRDQQEIDILNAAIGQLQKLPTIGKTMSMSSNMISPAKPALASTTIWGGIVSAISPIFFAILPSIAPPLAAAIPQPWGTIVTSVVGGIMVAYGRTKAVQPISGIISTK